MSTDPRQANKTTSAAVAASKAAFEANQIIKHEQRPWLDFDVEEWRNAQVQVHEGKIVGLIFFSKVKIINEGRTIAQDVVCGKKIWTATSFDDSERNLKIFEERINKAATLGTVVFPQKSIIYEGWGDGQAVQEDKIEKDGNSSLCCWFVSILSYRSENDWFYTSKQYSFTVPSVETSRVRSVIKLDELKPEAIPWGQEYNETTGKMVANVFIIVQLETLAALIK